MARHDDIRVLAFDIFGTVVDWHGSIVREVQALYPQVDADAFALAWRAGYQPAMQRVRSGHAAETSGIKAGWPGFGTKPGAQPASPAAGRRDAEPQGSRFTVQ